MNNAINGIDVSKHQGNINWDKVKSSGKVDFVILRAGYGRLASQKDAKFEEYYTECKKRNIPVGCYWYSYATTAAEAKLEAEACYQCIKGKSFEYPVFFDYEDKCQRTAEIAKAIIPAFIDTLSSKGYYVGLYSFKNLLDTLVPKEYQEKYDIWLAHWSSSTSYKGHTIWQTSEKGRVDGISGDVDLDTCYNLDYTDVIRKAGLNGLKKTEEVKPVVKPIVENNTATSKLTEEPTYKAGDKVILKKVPLYKTAYDGNIIGVQSGTYWIYSDESICGRVRITNSKSNVGKTPIGQYVTGWVSEEDLELSKYLDTGDKVNLKNVKLYSSSTSNNPSNTLNGDYYIYDIDKINGRVRITNSKSNVGKTPEGKYVTGWVNYSDIV